MHYLSPFSSSFFSSHTLFSHVSSGIFYRHYIIDCISFINRFKKLKKNYLRTKTSNIKTGNDVKEHNYSNIHETLSFSQADAKKKKSFTIELHLLQLPILWCPRDRGLFSSLTFHENIRTLSLDPSLLSYNKNCVSYKHLQQHLRVSLPSPS